MGLRGNMVRLAHANKELRPHLLPLLRQSFSAGNNFFGVYTSAGRNQIALGRSIPVQTTLWYSALPRPMRLLMADCQSLATFLKDTPVGGMVKIVKPGDALIRYVPAQGMFLLNFLTVPDVDGFGLDQLSFAVGQWGRNTGYVLKRGTR